MTAPGAVLMVLVAAALFGTTGTAQALGPEGTTPLGVGAVRLALGGLGLMLVIPLLGGRPRAALRLWVTPAGLMMGVCTAAYQVAFFAAVAQAGVAVGTLVAIGSGPLLAGVLARVVVGERPTRVWMLSTGLCLTGLALLVTGGGVAALDPVGVLLALAAGAAYAGYTVLAKWHLDRGHESSTVMASAFGLGGLLLLPLVLTQPMAWLGQPSGLAMALHLGLITITLAYLLFVRGLAVLPAGPVTTLMLAEPVVATTLGVLVLQERLALMSAAGVGVLLLGLLWQGLGAQRGGDAATGRAGTATLRRP